jgi:hypothetical protein
MLRLVRGLALVALAAGGSQASASAARRTPKNPTKCTGKRRAAKHGRSAKDARSRYKKTKTQECPKGPKRRKPTVRPKIQPTAPTVITLTAPTPGPTSPTQPSPPVPSCPIVEPLPTPTPWETTIVGYTRSAGGGPLLPMSCPAVPGGESVVLEDTAGQVLQTQSPGPGQPFNFVVEPSEYYVLPSRCASEKPSTAFVAQAENQNVDEGVSCLMSMHSPALQPDERGA